MAWDNLIAAVNAVITANGNNEITGTILKDLLNNNIIPQLGSNLYKGIATPSTEPGTPENEQVYIVNEAGVYANFGGVEIKEGEKGFLAYRNGVWVKDIPKNYITRIDRLDPATAANSDGFGMNLGCYHLNEFNDYRLWTKDTSGDIRWLITDVDLDNKLSLDYVYKGVVVSSTNPVTVSGKKQFVLAKTPGDYPHFGSGVSLDDGEVALLKFGGAAWSKDTIFPTINNPQFDFKDKTPTDIVEPAGGSSRLFFHRRGNSSSNYQGHIKRNGPQYGVDILATCGKADKDIYIGLSTDIHVDSDNANGDYYRGWLDLVGIFNQTDVNFHLSLGDNGEHQHDNVKLAPELEAYNNGLKLLSCPSFVCVGNHDAPNTNTPAEMDFYFDKIDEHFYKKTFPPFTGIKTGYYHVKTNGINLVVLNSNFDFTANPLNGTNNQNGIWSIGVTQEAWLQGVLSSFTANDDILIAIHVDPITTNTDTYYRINEAEQLRLQSYFEACAGRIILVANGHRHTNSKTVKNGITYITFKNNKNLFSKNRGNVAGAIIKFNQTDGEVTINGIGGQTSYHYTL